MAKQGIKLLEKNRNLLVLNFLAAAVDIRYMFFL